MNKKNAIIIPFYNSLKKNKNYRICLKTWEFYCEKYNIELILLETDKYFNNHLDHVAMCYDRWTEIKLPSSEYDRITFVDADTIVRWDFEDLNKILDENQIKIAVVKDQGGPMVPYFHFSQWKEFKPNVFEITKDYFNAGFVSIKSYHLEKIQEAMPLFKKYYYDNLDINHRPEGMGKPGGVRIDGLDQTAINICLQELFGDDVAFVDKALNLQLSYCYPNMNDFLNNALDYRWLNDAFIYHIGGLLLSQTHIDFANNWWENFKNKYKNE